MDIFLTSPNVLVDGRRLLNSRTMIVDRWRGCNWGKGKEGRVRIMGRRNACRNVVAVVYNWPGLNSALKRGAFWLTGFQVV